MSEVWTSVVGFTGYEVSDLGNVRTTRSKNGKGTCEPRPLLPRAIVGKIYHRVTLTDASGNRVDRKVHLLVLEAFRGPRPAPEMDGCHRDGNAHHNELSNLYWGTKRENAQDRVDHGTQVRGDTHPLSVLTEQQVMEIKQALPTWKRGMGRTFAKRFGVCESAITSVKLGRTWSHV
ncbi:hypothetical protein JJJA_0060 [Achromobacter phage JWDelta]|uniref:HNH endonuclease n=2 Tax=Jwalphavirus jwalpha TaxID=2169963 RepID=V9VG28_9CAUD|nr:HNH endonuclease [Achromobacter phage JWAlpha]AHC56576.1 hypothetical protein JJJA_0060 [Achromobacter phage JWDelta]AHC94016.1 hypothetical protein JJJB_0063 [Achromobacter phage JWAlpha]